MPRRRVVRRLLVLLLVGLPPWTVIRWTNPGGSVGYDSYFAYGLGTLFGPLGRHFTLLPTYLDHAVVTTYWQQAWPTGAFLYACALASVALGLIGREDRRVTAGLLGMAGAAELLHAVGLVHHNPRLLVLPIGTVLLWGVALARYRDALRRLVFVSPKAPN
ncbi:hypothetical protein MBEHAL_2394 [Halarchaeum acidiphilum MH1-52-1]|uniref:DUF8050 domain-containing protein n=1 Tax=Halarchaeum acidiphilum MH1-52-1 TaxID=1261545 RepID=U3A7H0_9EURY|nr:hypothetical protein [Halarchaeum acidiphilum]GAD53634.1 hypothetical protein MBEHAL_2394 [Halarchaeum acidiphilum MH1-52-1]